MSRLRSFIATTAAVTLTVGQLLCLCGPAMASMPAEMSSTADAQSLETGHLNTVPCHPDNVDTVSADELASEDTHSHDSQDCAHCAGNASSAAAHIDVIAAEGAGVKYPELVVLASPAASKAPIPTIVRSHWPPPQRIQRSPETLVSKKILLLI